MQKVVGFYITYQTWPIPLFRNQYQYLGLAQSQYQYQYLAVAKVQYQYQYLNNQIFNTKLAKTPIPQYQYQVLSVSASYIFTDTNWLQKYDKVDVSERYQ